MFTLEERQKACKSVFLRYSVFGHCNQKIQKTYSTELHKNVQMNIKWEWILKFWLLCDRISLVKSVQIHGNRECNNGN